MRLPVWIAQGFGTGCVPRAPGTVGSVVGVAWFGLLLLPGELWVFLAGAIGMLGVSVWACGAAERILGKHDPSSVVMDEIAAVPLCFAGAVVKESFGERGFPSVDLFFGGDAWVVTCLGFALFRLFDIWKPWPVGRSQALPRGWGVTADDVLAAVYVNVAMAPVVWWGAGEYWSGRVME